MPVDSDIGPTALKPILDDALFVVNHVSSSVGLLSDLYGEVGIARQDADATRLSNMLDLIREEAERVAQLIERAASQARVSAKGAPPSPAEGPNPRRTAATRQ